MSEELVNVERLGVWLDDLGLEVGQPITVAPLMSGRSNAMFTVHRGGSRWVLRRPALVAIERADEGMRREFRILDALNGSNVPHPETVALCDDREVLGCTFFLMQQVDGINPAPPLPEPFLTEDQPSVAFAMVEALAALHDFDWKSNGLADFGKPEGFHERQVQRWTSQLASYGGRELSRLENITTFLAAVATLRRWLRYSAPRFALQLLQAPTQLAWSFGSMPASTGITWSTSTAGALWHQ